MTHEQKVNAFLDIVNQYKKQPAYDWFYLEANEEANIYFLEIWLKHKTEDPLKRREKVELTLGTPKGLKRRK